MSPFEEVRRRNLDDLLSIVSTGMFTIDRESQVRSMNAEAERLLGLDSGQGVGRSCREVLGPEVCQGGGCSLHETLEDGSRRRDWPIRIRREDGTVRDVVMSTAYLSSPTEGGEEVAVAIRDVTDAEKVRRAIRDPWNFHGLVCASGKMKEIANLVREMAPYESTVLLLGESGTGKEIVARAIHREGPRAEGPFVTVNCSAYSEGVLESELFGHVQGAFTGAVRGRRGRFETATGGTVFLDEIGEIPPTIQVKLLRVLQEREIERVGESRPVPVDIRVVAATNRDLRRAVAEERFREDLFYRLNVITVHLPPLRERLEDVPALVDHFLPELARTTGKSVTAVSDEALDVLLRHEWPGNVRELLNSIEHAVVRSHGPVLRAQDLPPEVRGAELARRDLDRGSRVEAAMRAAGGRIGRAAEILGVHRTTLWRWLRREAAARPSN